MMDPEIKAKWLSDLRSGAYAQARERLRDADTYCCLGVLCRTVGAEFTRASIDDPPYVSGTFDNVPVLDGDILSEKDDQELNTSFLRRVGLTDKDQKELIIMNDGGNSFGEIADYIEEHL